MGGSLGQIEPQSNLLFNKRAKWSRVAPVAMKWQPDSHWPLELKRQSI
jgi:hypothetical protein